MAAREENPPRPLRDRRDPPRPLRDRMDPLVLPDQMLIRVFFYGAPPPPIPPAPV